MDESFLVEASAELELIFLETDLDGVIVQENDAMLKLTGYVRGELVGTELDLLRDAASPVWLFAEMWRELSTGHPWQGTIKIKCKSGTACWMDVTASAVKLSGQLAGYLFFLQHSSEQNIANVEARYRAEPSALQAFSLAHQE